MWNQHMKILFFFFDYTTWHFEVIKFPENDLNVFENQYEYKEYISKNILNQTVVFDQLFIILPSSEKMPILMCKHDIGVPLENPTRG